MEDTIYESDYGRNNYFDFLNNSSKKSRTEREFKLNKENITLHNKSFMNIESFSLKKTPAKFFIENTLIRPNTLDTLDKCVIIENMADHEDFVDFYKIFIWKNTIIAYKKDGTYEQFNTQTERILFGRLLNCNDDNTLMINLNSQSCSKNHCEVDVFDFFRQGKVPQSFYTLLFYSPKKIPSKSLLKVLEYLGPQRKRSQVSLKDLGSFLGAWLNVKKGEVRLNVNDFYLYKEDVYITVKSIFHKEYDQVVEELDSCNMNKFEINEQNLSHHTANLKRLFYSQRSIHVNDQDIQKGDIDDLVNAILRPKIQFSFVTLDINIDNCEEIDSILLMCVNKAQHSYNFDELTIRFANKRFHLKVKDLNSKKGVFNFWKSVSHKQKNNRFSQGIVCLDEDNFVMIGSMILNMKFLTNY